MHSIRIAALAACLLGLTACATGPLIDRTPAASRESASAQASSANRPSVLLVSIDGLRDDYLDLGMTPNLARIAADGVRAKWMMPSYPSLTFPNHYSIVTGLRPDHHGIVHNTMRDAQLGSFSNHNPATVGDGRWWGGTPVWVSAERAGMATASFFWPGSEAAIDGVRPTRWTPFDADIPLAERVDTVLGWLSEPDATRPRFVALYFDTLDKAGHQYGPDSPQAHAALREVDAMIGRLLDGLKARSLNDRVNLIVVSDHGMATVAAGHVVAVEDMIEPIDVVLVAAGQSVGFAPKPGRVQAAEAQLLGEHAHYQCWRKSELPPRWHYGSHPRIPPIVCQMDEGWKATTRERLAQRPADTTTGSHGYDPALESMHAVFLARGPALRRGVELPAFDNVDVYPLLMRLLGLKLEPNDGDDDALAALKSGAPSPVLAP